MNSKIGISIGCTNSCGIRKGSGFFGVEGLGDGTEDVHLGYGIIIAKNTMKVSVFNTICEI